MKYMRGKSEEANHNESCMGLAGIDYLGIERVLKRGTGDILERQDRAILVHDRVSGALMLGCEDAEAGAELLERHMNGAAASSWFPITPSGWLPVNNMALPGCSNATKRPGMAILHAKATAWP